jgi:hypothetical protein
MELKIKRESIARLAPFCFGNQSSKYWRVFTLFTNTRQNLAMKAKKIIDKGVEQIKVDFPIKQPVRYSVYPHLY